MEDLAADSNYLTRTIRLSDCFGDQGLISVIFGWIEADTLNVEGWLMSCRVLKRGVERLLLNEVVSVADVAGIRRIVGTYIPTDRNSLVSDHYHNLGFAPMEARDGTTTWSLKVDDFQPLDNFIDVVETGK